MVAMVYCQQLQSLMSQYLFAHGGYGLLSAVAVIDVIICLHHGGYGLLSAVAVIDVTIYL